MKELEKDILSLIKTIGALEAIRDHMLQEALEHYREADRLDKKTREANETIQDHKNKLLSLMKEYQTPNRN